MECVVEEPRLDARLGLPVSGPVQRSTVESGAIGVHSGGFSASGSTGTATLMRVKQPREQVMLAPTPRSLRIPTPTSPLR